MPQNTLRVRLLGSLDIQLEDQPLPPLDSARAESLLAYLLLHRDAPQPRQRLAFLLWPGSGEPATARAVPQPSRPRGSWPSYPPVIARCALAIIAAMVSASCSFGLNWTNSVPASAAGTCPGVM